MARWCIGHLFKMNSICAARGDDSITRLTNQVELVSEPNYKIVIITIATVCRTRSSHLLLASQAAGGNSAQGTTGGERLDHDRKWKVSS